MADKTKSFGAIAGPNIYTNKYGQNILYDKKAGKGYVIRKDDEGRFIVYQYRWLVAILIAVFGINLGADWKLMVPAGAAVFVILQVMYRNKFLPSLTVMKKFVPEQKRTMVDSLAETQTAGNCVIYGIVLVVFGIMMVVNGIAGNAGTFMHCINAAILAGCVFLSSRFLLAAKKISSQK